MENTDIMTFLPAYLLSTFVVHQGPEDSGGTGGSSSRLKFGVWSLEVASQFP